MPSFQDSAFLILLALLLFGPKGLAKLARELGKLMGEFRRASNEFRMQMEDEFRLVEQEEARKKAAAIEAAAPPQLGSTIPEPEHPHMPPPPPSMLPETSLDTVAEPTETAEPIETENRIDPRPAEDPPVSREPLPIASEGGVSMMPPASGLPVSRSHRAFEPVIPVPEEPKPTVETEQEAPTNG